MLWKLCEAKSAFPTVEFDKRRGKYRNLRRSIAFDNEDKGSGLQVVDNTEVDNLQKTFVMHKQKAKMLMDEIVANSSVTDNIYLQTLITL
jgi:hypothetical protein